LRLYHKTTAIIKNESGDNMSKTTIFKNDELQYALNKHFAQYNKMIRETKVNDLYYNWCEWCNDIMCGYFGGNRVYANCDKMVYDWCMQNGYLVMTN